MNQKAASATYVLVSSRSRLGWCFRTNSTQESCGEQPSALEEGRHALGASRFVCPAHVVKGWMPQSSSRPARASLWLSSCEWTVQQAWLLGRQGVWRVRSQLENRRKKGSHRHWLWAFRHSWENQRLHYRTGNNKAFVKNIDLMKHCGLSWPVLGVAILARHKK